MGLLLKREKEIPHFVRNDMDEQRRFLVANAPRSNRRGTLIGMTGKRCNDRKRIRRIHIFSYPERSERSHLLERRRFFFRIHGIGIANFLGNSY
jgi:hypothetical protein